MRWPDIDDPHAPDKLAPVPAAVRSGSIVLSLGYRPWYSGSQLLYRTGKRGFFSAKGLPVIYGIAVRCAKQWPVAPHTLSREWAVRENKDVKENRHVRNDSRAAENRGAAREASGGPGRGAGEQLESASTEARRSQPGDAPTVRTAGDARGAASAPGG